MSAVSESDPPLSARFPLANTIHRLSLRLVAAQRSIRPLEAVGWDDEIEHRFLRDQGRELPAVTRDTYRFRPLPFEPQRKLGELQDLERDIALSLGSREGAGCILTRMCREYASLVHMLTFRGTKTFVSISAKLFGTAGDAEHGLSALAELSRRFPPRFVHFRSVRNAEEAQQELAERLRPCFPEWPNLRIKLVDNLIADAAAGSSYLKLRRDGQFTIADLRLLEVHEGWVHLGTSYNSRAQGICAFLRKAPPSSTRTQEGLAVLTEFVAGVATAERVRRLAQRVQAIGMAEQGADFLQVFRFIRETEPDDREAYQQTARVFRGSLPAGCGPFTKDLCYVTGLGDLVEMLKDRRQAALLPLLFSGKTALADLPLLADFERRGWLTRPKFLPAAFDNVGDLAARVAAA